MNLRDIIGHCQKLLDLPEGVAKQPTGDLVRLGADLWTLTGVSRQLAEVVKDLLRSRVPPTPGKYHMTGPGASCHVLVSPPQPVLRKDFDLQALQKGLGADFDRLFEVTQGVTPRADFLDTFQTLPQDKIPALLAALDQVEHRPRVSFQISED